MGKVLAPVGSMFGIGQKDDPTFQPGQANTAAYTKFSQENPAEIQGVAGSKIASEQVRNDPLSSGLFGAGGLQDRLGAEEQDLASRGYQLRPEDREAYGQAAGDIARLYGQQEQAGTQALARRGLAAGNSGAAGAMFSGLQGSKNEQLARAQTDIAQKRMADTTQRLQSTRNLMGQLGAQGQSALSNQFNRQLQGRQERGDELYRAMTGEQAINNQNRQANEDAIGHKSKNIGDAWAEGKYSGTKSGEADATASWMKMGGSSSMGMSDENNKTNVRDGSKAVQGLLSTANSHDYSSPASSGDSGKSGGNPMEMVSGLFGGGSSGGGASMFSDENNKKNVHGGGPQIQLFLDSAQPHEYEYKDSVKDNPLAGEGTYVSPMAQDLEKSPLGAEMVKDTPDGKVVDYGKGFGTLLAGLGDVNNRLKALEGKK